MVDEIVARSLIQGRGVKVIATPSEAVLRGRVSHEEEVPRLAMGLELRGVLLQGVSNLNTQRECVRMTALALLRPRREGRGEQRTRVLYSIL